VRRLNDLVIAAPVRLSEIQSTLQVGIMVVNEPSVQHMLAHKLYRLQRAVLEALALLFALLCLQLITLFTALYWCCAQVDGAAAVSGTGDLSFENGGLKMVGTLLNSGGITQCRVSPWLSCTCFCMLLSGLPVVLCMLPFANCLCIWRLEGGWYSAEKRRHDAVQGKYQVWFDVCRGFKYFLTSVRDQNRHQNHCHQ
jgi:hypothetical protein